MEVKLSEASGGTVVVFKSFYSHKADKVLWEELNRDVKIERDADGNLVKNQIPAGNVARAYEAVLPLIIESPAVTQEWLDDLPRDDYGKLYQAALDLYTQSSDKKDKGKKGG